MSGSLFALAVDPFLRGILVGLEAYADDRAIVLANLEHYLYCPLLLPMARHHLRLDLAAVRARGVFGVMGHLGQSGGRGFRLAIHLDATLVAYDRLRHGRAGGPCGLYAGRVKETSWRHPAVAAVVRRGAAERRRAAESRGAGFLYMLCSVCACVLLACAVCICA